MKKTIKILTLIALILIFRPIEGNHTWQDLYFVNQAINLPDGYEPIKLIYKNKTDVKWIIKDRKLKTKPWR